MFENSICVFAHIPYIFCSYIVALDLKYFDDQLSD